MMVDQIQAAFTSHIRLFSYILRMAVYVNDILMLDLLKKYYPRDTIFSIGNANYPICE